MIDLSPFAATLKGRPVAVYGLAKSGLATVQALVGAGIPVYAHDDDPEKRATVINAGARPLSADFDELKTCAVLVLSPGIPLHFPSPHPVVMAAHAHGVDIIGDIEIFARAKTGCKTIGITGTNGKSTTTALIAHTLSVAGHPALACGNLGTPILEITINNPETVIVVELSSFQLDLCPTFTPDISVHLNLTPDHLDRHGTLENYIAIKEKIFNGPGIGFCGVDDAPSQDMCSRAQQNRARRMIPVSCTRIVNGGLYLNADTIINDVFGNENSIPLTGLPALRGAHNHQNALMAYGVACAIGIEPSVIRRAFETYPGLPHRQISVRTINHVEYINDSKATNADATEKALKTFDRIYWIVGGLPKAGGLSGLESFAPKIRHAYLIGSASQDFARFMTEHKIKFTPCGTIETAVSSAHKQAQSDVSNGMKAGVVLLSPACASYDQFDSYEHRGHIFTQLVENLNPPYARAS